jgi:hypothetical protein
MRRLRPLLQNEQGADPILLLVNSEILHFSLTFVALLMLINRLSGRLVLSRASTIFFEHRFGKSPIRNRIVHDFQQLFWSFREEKFLAELAIGAELVKIKGSDDSVRVVLTESGLYDCPFL